MRIFRYQHNKVVVYAAKQPPLNSLDEIAERMEKEDADALILGTYPALFAGYIDPREYCCSYPQSIAYAMSREAEKRFGRMDIGLDVAAAYQHVRHLLSRGGRVVFSGDILLENHETPDITDYLLSSSLLDAKHGSYKSFIKSFSRIIRAFRKDPSVGDHSRKKLLAAMPFFLIKTLWYLTLGHRRDSSIGSVDFTEINKRGNYIAAPVPLITPLVSVIIRTHNRPNVLRETLKSLQHQAYKNIEYIVVEDGASSAKSMVETEFSHLPFYYHATEKNVGRSAAANIGFFLAKGKYINMLDDDDFFYPEHILTGVAEAEARNCDMVFLQSLAILSTTVSDTPYRYEIKEVRFMNFPRIDAFTMAQQCMTPNNGVLFRRKLYEELGGMREDLGAHEDWNLWLRYMTRAKWCIVPYATCAFLNPFSLEEREERVRQYAPYDGMQFADPALIYRTEPEELNNYYRGCIEDWHCLIETGQFEEQLRAELLRRNNSEPCEAEQSRDLFAEAVNNVCEQKLYTALDFRSLYESFLKYLGSLSPSEAREYVFSKYMIYNEEHRK